MSTRPIPQAAAPRRARTVNRHFLRHYAVMVAVMFAGMAILGAALELVLGLFGTGYDEVHRDAPAGALLMMMLTMVAPMVAYMAYKGHSVASNVEMALAMIAPTLAAVGVLATGLITDLGTLYAAEHVLMLLAMFGVMLLRPEEYSHRHDA